MQSGPGGSLRCCSSSEYISASPASGGSVTHSCEERGTDSADEASGGTPARRLLARRRQGGPGAGVFVQGWAGVGGGAAGSWEPPPRLGEAVSVGCVQTQPVRGSVVRGAGGRRGGCRARGRGPAAPSRPPGRGWARSLPGTIRREQWASEKRNRLRPPLNAAFVSLSLRLSGDSHGLGGGGSGFGSGEICAPESEIGGRPAAQPRVLPRSR